MSQQKYIFRTQRCCILCSERWINTGRDRLVLSRNSFNEAGPPGENIRMYKIYGAPKGGLSNISAIAAEKIVVTISNSVTCIDIRGRVIWTVPIPARVTDICFFFFFFFFLEVVFLFAYKIRVKY